MAGNLMHGALLLFSSHVKLVPIRKRFITMHCAERNWHLALIRHFRGRGKRLKSTNVNRADGFTDKRISTRSWWRLRSNIGLEAFTS